MTNRQKQIEGLQKEAAERELMSQLAANSETRRINTQRAGHLRQQIEELRNPRES